MGGGTSFSQRDVPEGTYTITYNPVDGYVPPRAETANLVARGTVSFLGAYVTAPKIVTPLDQSQPRSAYIAITGTGVPDVRVAIWVDGAVRAVTDVDSSGSWERVVFAGIGQHQLRVQYENNLDSLSEATNVVVNNIFPNPLVNRATFEKLRRADVLLTLSQRSGQIRLFRSCPLTCSPVPGRRPRRDAAYCRGCYCRSGR